jgi:hypothetical protein
MTLEVNVCKLDIDDEIVDVVVRAVCRRGRRCLEDDDDVESLFILKVVTNVSFQ